jgi:hypothetical protein
MGIKKNELLTEVAGVPKAIKKWTDAFNLTILNILDVPTNKPLKEWKKTTITIDGVKLKKIPYLGLDIAPNAYQKFVNMSFNVNSHEELLETEDFKKLPLNKPKFKLSFTIIPKNRWGTDNPGNVMGEAVFSRDENAKIVDDKIEGVTFSFDLYLKEGTLKGNTMEGQIKDFLGGTHGLIAHELTHAYQYYQETTSKDVGDIPHWQFGKEGVLNWVQQIMGKVSKSDDWNEFTKLVYYHLSFEGNARTTQLFYDMQVDGVSNTEEFREYLKNSRIYKIADELTKFNAEQFVNSFESPYQDFELDRAEGLKDILRLGFNPIRNWEELKLRLNKDKRNKFMLWSLIREWSRVVGSFENVREKYYSEGGASKLDPVPEEAKKDPMVFFKFFEKRFHERGEEFKRKLAKLASHYQGKDSLGNKRSGVYGRMAARRNNNNRLYNKDSFDDMVKEGIDDLDWIKQTTTPYIDLFNSTFGDDLRVIGGLGDGEEQLNSIERILRSGWNASVACMDDVGKVQLDKVEVENFELLTNGPNKDVSGWRLLFTQYCHDNPTTYTAFKSGNNPIIYIQQSLNESNDFDWVDGTSARNAIEQSLIDWLSKNYDREDATEQINNAKIYYDRETKYYKILYDNGVYDIVKLYGDNVIHSPKRMDNTKWTLIESDDLQWIDDIDPNDMPADIYAIPENQKFIFKYQDNLHDVTFIRIGATDEGGQYAKFSGGPWGDFIITNDRYLRWVRLGKLKISYNINESDDLQWISDTDSLHGFSFKLMDTFNTQLLPKDTVVTIEEDDNITYKLKWRTNDVKLGMRLPIGVVKHKIKIGEWVLVTDELVNSIKQDMSDNI